MTPDKTAQRFAKLKDEAERETRFQEREAYWQRWIDDQLAAWIEGGGTDDLEAGDLIPEALAQHHDLVDQEMAAITTQMRAENGALRRAIIEREIAHASERRQRVEQAGAMRRKIAVLETRLDAEREARDEMRKEIAGLAKELARDRAHRLLLDARRSYPRSSKIELEKARRRTDRLIEDRLIEDRALEGGSFDA